MCEENFDCLYEFEHTTLRPEHIVAGNYIIMSTFNE